MELTDKEKKDAIISSLKALKRYTAFGEGDGYYISDSDLAEEVDGNLVKWEDIEKIINSI